VRQPLGQHFLHDGKVVKTILAAAELKPGDSVLEIGPGKGVLTFELANRVQRLVAIELDRKLAENLKKKFSGNPRVSIIHADFLKTSLSDVIPECPCRGSMDPLPVTAGDDEEKRILSPIKVLGNLPYSITSPIFEKLMSWPGWDTGVFLIQREVAERIASPAGSRAYGILTLAIQLFAEVETILQVPPGAFAPPPRVSSTVIRLRRKKSPEVPPELIGDFFDLAHGAFAHRRKTIANSLALFTGQTRASIEKWLCQQKIPAGARAETIALREFAQLAVAWSIFRREMNLTSHPATSTILRT
jgi:16S rRNA (adenine1518-N6/adenine1519-N6)-dimethyltransferase